MKPIRPLVALLLTAALCWFVFPALAFETATPAQGDIPEREAIQSAARRLTDVHKLDPLMLEQGYDAAAHMESSSGFPERFWQVVFSPKPEIADTREYYFHVDAAAGNIVTSGWRNTAGAADEGGGAEPPEAGEIITIAGGAINAYYGLKPDELEHSFTVNPPIETVENGVRVYEVYFLPYDLEAGHYYVTVSVETGAVMRVHYSEMQFG